MLSKLNEEIEIAAATVVPPKNIFRISRSWRDGFQLDTRLNATITYDGILKKTIKSSNVIERKRTPNGFMYEADTGRMRANVINHMHETFCDIIDNYGESKNNRVSVLFRWYRDESMQLLRTDVQFENDMYGVYKYILSVHESNKKAVFPGVAQALKLLKTKYEGRL